MIICGSGQFGIGSESKIERTRLLAELFVDSCLEDMFLAVKWQFAITVKRDIEGRKDTFIEVPDIEDCLRVVAISPSITEWFIDDGKLIFKGERINAVFYYSSTVLDSILSHSEEKISSSYITLSSIYLASQIAHSIYSDSSFTEGLKAQYLRKLEDVRRIHYFDSNLLNSGNV